ITYAYTITNTGNVTLTGPFNVSDDKVSVTCAQPASLAPGGTVSCSATYTLTQADIDAGSVTNHATASAKFGSTTVSSAQATATVSIPQAPSISLMKSVTPQSYDAAGDVLTYAYRITNTGNVTLAGPFSVTDDHIGTISPCGSGP